MDKIHNLAKIKEEDCNLVDKFMTKYSYCEHSQPDETPMIIPDPDERAADVEEVLAWLKKFTKHS